MYFFKTISLACLTQTLGAAENIIYRCTDPSAGVPVFSQFPCQNIPSNRVEINLPNIAPALTQSQRQKNINMDARGANTKLRNTKSGSNHRAITKQLKRCTQNQHLIDLIQIKLKQGYKYKEYDYYHDKLRRHKKYRNQYC